MEETHPDTQEGFHTNTHTDKVLPQPTTEAGFKEAL